MVTIDMLTEKVKERFWAKVSKSDDGCWLWMGSCDRGYGQLTIAYNGIRVHRVSWLLHEGNIPIGFCVCHHCDVKNCVRPDHLFLGTQKDNIMDASVKGRMRGAVNGHRNGMRPESRPKGETHRSSKLTDAAVNEIRSLYKQGGITQLDLAEKFGVNDATVFDVVHRNTWKHLEP